MLKNNLYFNKIKNKNKGDQGYMLYARNKNNMCNIAYRTFYPIVAK
jgi:hypothetical protein